ncbi:DNA-3-methyladenine glycosylase 2 [Zhongshania aliphaticivorans]|uniref:DNA-3-methyladenine glycosylase II n=1 Tax=Zhongshania aliphaticivorans TaxID=1470434 RepID=A0A5S9NT66_9GAMM|nr:DNA-3-methyladenine glycosylase 2 family protein [Zhongshania aliphaticivorans]CAA0093855.1 DNA-3-methyladenine glycosylase 2 [Zhongshania aliphaticivorans]CAA0111929.1 DNA-3-methyladenine glycosylase 2 [Zhongshania aliphaticivorans]
MLSNEQVVSLTLTLPMHYRFKDVLAFHGRDKEQVSERIFAHGYKDSGASLDGGDVQDDSFEKALIWQGRVCCLRVIFLHDIAKVSLCWDGSLFAPTEKALVYARLNELAGRILGLNQDVDTFEHKMAALFVGQLQYNRGLRVPQSVSPFEALCWAVIGQQISVSAAISIRRRFIQQFGVAHSNGLLCHPDPALLASADVASLRSVGLSATKARTLLDLAHEIDGQSLVLPVLDDGETVDTEVANSISKALCGIRGIGPWTVNYALLRGFAFLDGSLHGDVAVRRNLQKLLQQEDKVTPEQAQHWLAQCAPWRALAAAHLWALDSGVNY